MQPQVRSATLIAFPQRQAGCFTVHDRIELLEWEVASRARGRGFSRLVLHEQQPIDGNETCDFLLLYAGEDPWARWGVARRGRSINVWRCADGAELGPFDRMRDALGAALEAAAWTPGRRGRGTSSGLSLGPMQRGPRPGEGRTAALDAPERLS